jgi:predicted secreted Zn-dependent protease
MKKLLYTLAGLSALALMASCNKEAERPASLEGEVVTATFTVAAPEGVATKAISDGTTATELIVAVYDETGKYLDELSTHVAKTGAAPTWNVSMKVIKDMTYQFVFLAKKEAAVDNGFCHFDAANAKISIDYSAVPANSDAADFFFVQDRFKVENSFSKTEEMHRPLAQVNFGASDLAEAGYSIKTDNTMLTGVTLTGIHSEMDVLTGEVTGAAGNVTFAQAARVSETSQFVTNYDRIAMVYALVAKNQANVSATLNVTAKGAKNTTPHAITREIANVPLKRNYRTNILGNIFTNDFNFTVNTVPGFATPEINETLQTSIAKANDLFAAGQTSVTVDLAPDADGIITLPATTEYVRLNLNITTDKTITIQYASGAKPAHVEIYAKDVENIVAELTSSTVIITSGSHIHTGTFATAASTLIVEATAKVDNLVVNAGSTKIYGEVGTISGDAADKAAYYIATVDELKAFRDLVNGGKTYEKVKVVLENDLDLSSVTNWTPIGTPSTPFKGQFDGNGKTISHLTIDNTADNIPQALFGYLVGYGASFRAMVKNLTVDGADIKAQNDHGTAVVVGSAGGYTTVSEVTVKNATLLANRKVGGVANGYIQVLNCHAENVSVTAIPNEKDATYDNGDKVGAIVGFHGEGSIEVIGNTADNVTVRAYRDLGGIIGIAHTDNIIKNNTVTNSTIIRDASTNKYADESKNAGKVIGRYGTNVTNEGNVAGDDVKVIGLFADGIEEDEEGILHILSKTGLESFRDLANAGNTFSGKTFVLDADIDLNNEIWTPIYLNGDATKFAGVFDGNGKTISNLKIDLTSAPAYQAAGFFGAFAGTIKNITFDGASVKNLTTGSASVNGTAVVVGSMPSGGIIENVTVKNAAVEANRYCGGIVGYVSGTVKDCAVEQLSIICKPDNLGGSYDNGDKCGGIYGYLNSGTNSIIGNSISNFSIRSYRDMGGIGGTALVAGTISGNTATNGIIIIDQKTNSYGTKDANAHEVLGRINATPTISDNVFENVEIIEYIADGVYSKNGIIHVTNPASLAIAVSEAPDGAIIALADGIYNSSSNLEIKKNLTIKAENDKQAQIDGKVIITNDKTIRLENLLLQNDHVAPATLNQWYNKTNTAIVGSYNGSIEVDNCLIKTTTNIASLYLYGANSAEDHLYVTNSIFDGSLAYAADPSEGFRPLMCQGNLKVENCTFIKLDRYVCQMYGTGGGYASTITVTGNKVDNPTSPDNYSVANILSVGSGSPLDNVVIDVHGNTDLDGNAKQFTYACKKMEYIGNNITYADGCDTIEWKLQNDLKGQ